MGGTGQLLFAPSGVNYTFTLPLDRLQPVTE